MPSPFPGMDPYIEAPELWSDFHSDLAGEIRAGLNRSIQPRYVARLTPAAVESRIALEVPLHLNRVEIRFQEASQLVTVIEILSPVNKRPGHEAFADYRRKRRDLLRTEVHLLEIDLLRGGTRPPLETEVPPAPYYGVLSRAERRPTVEVWPIRLQAPLPTLPVPLLPPDGDTALELGTLVAGVYDRGGYGSLIDYSAPPPPPPLSEEERVWLGALLRGLGTANEE